MEDAFWIFFCEVEVASGLEEIVGDVLFEEVDVFVDEGLDEVVIGVDFIGEGEPVCDDAFVGEADFFIGDGEGGDELRAVGFAGGDF